MLYATDLSHRQGLFLLDAKFKLTKEFNGFAAGQIFGHSLLQGPLPSWISTAEAAIDTTANPQSFSTPVPAVQQLLRITGHLMQQNPFMQKCLTLAEMPNQATGVLAMSADAIAAIAKKYHQGTPARHANQSPLHSIHTHRCRPGISTVLTWADSFL